MLFKIYHKNSKQFVKVLILTTFEEDARADP